MQPEDIPDWVARLGAEPCDTTPADWSRWSASVATYCLAFHAMNPKRNKREWREHWPDEYGKVILRPRDGSARTVAEIEVTKAFRDAGWVARWTDTFHKAPGWMRPWTQVENVPRTVSEHLNAIRAASPTAKPWDVLAWRDDVVMFVECKAEGEGCTKAESAFIWGAHEAGVPLDCFAVVRGSISFPSRPDE